MTTTTTTTTTTTANTTNVVAVAAVAALAARKKKRLCPFPGCARYIKSQGHCQRHGEKPKRCMVWVNTEEYDSLFYSSVLLLWLWLSDYRLLFCCFAVFFFFVHGTRYFCADNNNSDFLFYSKLLFFLTP